MAVLLIVDNCNKWLTTSLDQYERIKQKTAQKN